MAVKIILTRTVPEWVVISKWQRRYQWDQWALDPRRQAIQQEIEELLGSPTEIAVYEYE